MLDYDAAAIAAEYARHRQVHPGVLCDLMETSGLGSGSRVLEVGCGTGNYIKALARLTGCQAHGIDPSGVPSTYPPPCSQISAGAGGLGVLGL